MKKYKVIFSPEHRSGTPLPFCKVLIFPPLSPKGLCRNDGRGEFRMEQAVRLLSFRMRSLKIMDNPPSWKCNSFHGLGVMRPNKKRLPL
jgi:hypothetical protein